MDHTLSHHTRESDAKGAAATRPVLSHFNDYRLYLKNFYLYKKQQHATGIKSLRGYGYSDFAAAADLKSPQYLRMVIAGERNLTESSIDKFAQALQLSRAETDEFRLLVFYNQANDPLEKNDYLRTLTEMRGQQQIQKGEVTANLWEKVTNWVAWVLFAMVDQKDVDYSVENLQRLICSRTNKDQLKGALEGLLASNDLIRNPQTNVMTRSRDLIAAARAIPRELIRRIQTEFIYLAVESLYKDDPDQREISGLTMALTREEFEEVKFILRKTRKDILTKYSARRKMHKGDQVFQLNLQFFPLSHQAKK